MATINWDKNNKKRLQNASGIIDVKKERELTDAADRWLSGNGGMSIEERRKLAREVLNKMKKRKKKRR